MAYGDATRTKVHGDIEQVFATEKRCMRLLVRTIGLAREMAKITLANLANSL